MSELSTHRLPRIMRRSAEQSLMARGSSRSYNHPRKVCAGSPTEAYTYSEVSGQLLVNEKPESCPARLTLPIRGLEVSSSKTQNLSEHLNTTQLRCLGYPARLAYS